MKTGVVKEFVGDYSFLSNFHMADFMWRNVRFPTAEHAFAYAKGFCATSPEDCDGHFAAVLKATTPNTAKKLGRGLAINVEEWDKIKVQYMREIVHAKFNHNESDEDLVGKLINTGAMMLVEGNTWGDTFWGRCGGKGFNTLGVILMEERGFWSRGSKNFVPAWETP